MNSAKCVSIYKKGVEGNQDFGPTFFNNEETNKTPSLIKNFPILAYPVIFMLLPKSYYIVT